MLTITFLVIFIVSLICAYQCIYVDYGCLSNGQRAFIALSIVLSFLGLLFSSYMRI